MRTLMGHLAQFASFSKQGELLCTQSVTYLLKNNEAQRAFSSFLSVSLDTPISESLFWRAEYVQSDGGRPDIEGCNVDGEPIVKIEGKLGAEFGVGQLESYRQELSKLNCQGNLVVLIPKNRYAEATEYVVNNYSLKGNGPWRPHNVNLAIISWENLFHCLETVADQEFREDLSQLHAMYRVLNGDDMEPLTTDEEDLTI